MQKGAQSVEEVCEIVRAHERVEVRGGGTKWKSAPDGMAGVITPKSGIVEYDPAEFTIILRAGTTLSEINAALGAQGQYLPFDPMFADEGATIGGTVAAGMNGPGRLRYGGVRDFIIGVEIVTGEGNAIRGGGKVVKNAAGFDLPKLMVGSLGRLGVMTEVAFKVFPRPEASVSAVIDAGSLREAVNVVSKLARGPFDVEAVELLPPGRVVFRISGHEAALRARMEDLRKRLGLDAMELSDAAVFWKRALSWDAERPGCLRVKVPVTPSVIEALDAKLDGMTRRYSVACNVAFIDWPRERDVTELDASLASLGLGGMRMGDEMALIGRRVERDFLLRVKAALDPANKLGDIE